MTAATSQVELATGDFTPVFDSKSALVAGADVGISIQNFTGSGTATIYSRQFGDDGTWDALPTTYASARRVNVIPTRNTEYRVGYVGTGNITVTIS